jgi:hypothetical protein
MKHIIQRLARVSYAFVVMNAAAVIGLFAFGLGRRVWR